MSLEMSGSVVKGNGEATGQATRMQTLAVGLAISFHNFENHVMKGNREAFFHNFEQILVWFKIVKGNGQSCSQL